MTACVPLSFVSVARRVSGGIAGCSPCAESLRWSPTSPSDSLGVRFSFSPMRTSGSTRFRHAG